MRTMIISNCKECPFQKEVHEHGYHSIDCSRIKGYSQISEIGFRKDCPILKNGGITVVALNLKI